MIEPDDLDLELEEQGFALSAANEQYRHGICHIMALALNRVSGWPLAAWVEHVDGLGTCLVHAFVLPPQAPGCVVDVQGLQRQEDLIPEFPCDDGEGGMDIRRMNGDELALLAESEDTHFSQLEEAIEQAMPIARQAFALAMRQLAIRPRAAVELNLVKSAASA